MANDNARDIDRAWELMKKIGFAMLVTRDGDKLRARPMSAYLERESNAIYFLTDARRHKDDEIARNPNINLSFADAGSQKYVSVTGTAVVSNDRAKIKQLFSTPAKAWWDSADDPNIRVLKITPDDAEFWDSPGTVDQLCEDGGGRRHRHTARYRRKPQGLDVTLEDERRSPDEAKRNPGQCSRRERNPGCAPLSRATCCLSSPMWPEVSEGLFR